MLAVEQASRLAAPFVQRLGWCNVDVARELEHRVRARVHDGLAGPEVLFAEPSDDLGPRCRFVSEDLSSDRSLERLDHFGRKAVRVGRERPIENDAGELPATSRGVLPGGPFG